MYQRSGKSNFNSALRPTDSKPSKALLATPDRWLSMLTLHLGKVNGYWLTPAWLSHRFEIEETFKDMKHIWELKRTRLNNPNSLKAILWLVSIGIALLYLTTKPTKQSLYSGHTKKQTSWLRQAYEQLQQATNLLLWGQG